MEPNVLSVVQQLTSNPQLVTQLQSILALLTPTQSGSGSSVQPDGEASQRMAAMGSSSLCSSVATAAPPPSVKPHTSVSHRQHFDLGPHNGHHRALSRGFVQRPSSSISSRHSTSRNPIEEGNDLNNFDATLLDRYEQLVVHCRNLEQQLETCDVTNARRRVTQLEEEVKALTQRVEQLTGIVEQQKRLIKDREGTHSLEIAEMKHQHEATIQKIAAEHDEVLRQVIHAQQLTAAAMHYSSVVKDDKGKCGEGGAENGNKTTLHSSNRSEARVLSAANGPSGKRLVASNATSMKQTRPTSVSDADQFRVVKPTSDDNDVGVRWPKSVKRERDEVGSRSPSARRKKRTPRTPSLTAADRMAAVSPPNPHYNGLATSDRTRIDSQGFSEKAPTSVPAAAVGSAGVANKKTYSAGSSWTAAHNTLRDVPSRHFDLAQDDANSEADAKASAIATLPLPRPLSSGTTPPRALLPTAGGLYRTPRLRGQRLQLQGRGGMRSGTSSVVGGPTRSPSPINPRRGAEQLRVFVLTSVSEEERERIKFAIEAIGQRASILDSSPDDLPPVTMTHIVLRGPPRSTKALCGVVAAKWLVQPEYVYASQEAGFWLDEYEEGGFRCFPPPLKCQRFLLTLPDNIVRDKLVQVIEYGGGEVIQKDKSRRGHDQGVVVISSGDELLRFATRQGNL